MPDLRTAPLLSRERLLLQVSGRDWGRPPSFLLVYPNRYAVGMTNLGYQFLLRALLADRSETFDRGFALASGRASLFPEPGRPVPRSLVLRRPWADFPAHLVSLSFETDQLHYLRGLREAGIPLRPADRLERHPLIVVGGAAVNINPFVPLAWADAVVCGEGEPVLGDVLETISDWRKNFLSRWQAVAALRELPGILTAENYQAVTGHRLPRADSLDPDPARTVVMGSEKIFSAGLLCELSRGCGRGCRFCSVGFGCGPVRFLSAAAFAEMLDGLEPMPPEACGLVGASLADHPGLPEILGQLLDRGLAYSTSSLRLDRVEGRLLDLILAGGSRTLTFAPEAGTERLRRAIGKPLSSKRLEDSLQRLAASQTGSIKLYFMVGLPSETDHDIERLGDLLEKAVGIFRARGRPGALKVGIAPFVPKAWTPFQWARFGPVPHLEAKLRSVRQLAKRLGLRLTCESARVAEVEALLAQGGIAEGELLVRFIANEGQQAGAAAFRLAFGGAGGALARLGTEKGADAAFPWDRLDVGQEKSRLRRWFEAATET